MPPQSDTDGWGVDDGAMMDAVRHSHGGDGADGVGGDGSGDASALAAALSESESHVFELRGRIGELEQELEQRSRDSAGAIDSLRRQVEQLQVLHAHVVINICDVLHLLCIGYSGYIGVAASA